MGIALVAGQKASAQSAATGTNISVAFPANVTTGNLIPVKVSCGDGQTVTSVTDTPLNSYAAAVQLDQTQTGQRIEGWYAKNIAGGADTVQANFSASVGFRSIAITEWSGADTTAPLGQVASSNNTGTEAAATSGTDKTPTEDGNLVWGAIVTDASAINILANSPFTLRESELTNFTGSEDQVQGAAAAVHSSFDVTGSSFWGVIMVLFKP